MNPEMACIVTTFRIAWKPEQRCKTLRQPESSGGHTRLSPDGCGPDRESEPLLGFQQAKIVAAGCRCRRRQMLLYVRFWRRILFRAYDRAAALAHTPVLPAATRVGALSALLRGSAAPLSDDRLRPEAASGAVRNSGIPHAGFR